MKESSFDIIFMLLRMEGEDGVQKDICGARGEQIKERIYNQKVEFSLCRLYPVHNLAEPFGEEESEGQCKILLKQKQ